MKLAVVGSREYDDYLSLVKILDLFLSENPELKLVSGGAKGADSLAARWAKENNIPILEIIPDWNKHGKAAGFIRNSEIWDNADMGIAFWDGKSKGTAHSFGLARKSNKTLIIVNYTDGTITNNE